MSQFFTSGGQSTGFSFNISPSNEYSGLISFRMDWLDSLQSKGLSRVFSNTTDQKHQFFRTQPSLWSHSHLYMTTGKNIALTIRTFVSKVMSLIFNTPLRWIIAFLLRSKHLFISPFIFIFSFQSPSTGT